MQDSSTEPVDVIVLGSGLAGSILASVLAANGVSVQLVERGRHPRMAIGESLLPTSAMWFWRLGEKHDIPELRTLAHLDSVTRNIAPSSGIKRGFSFTYHREDQERLEPDESVLFVGPKQPIFRESQFYRADVDHYLVKAAVRLGVRYRDNTTVTGVEVDDAGARITVDDGSTITGRYVVDATGRNSVLADAFGLREDPCRLRHHSRSIFTHMTGVQPFEAVEPTVAKRKMSAGCSEGTLHHVFDGGWFWVIPFDNHAGSTSDLVSVGLTVDPRKHPSLDGIEPEKEFASFVERFPVIERHLGPGEAARPFVGTDRLQYSSTTSVGDRFLLLQHAYGFVDPLFSRGIWRSLEAVDVIADELLSALVDDDLSAERFAAVDRMQAAMLDDNDQLVFNAFRAMADHETWTAWVRLWFAEEFATTMPVLAATFGAVTTGDTRAFDRIAGTRRPGTDYSFSPALQALIDDADLTLDEVDAGTVTPAQARDRICGALATARYLPHNLLDFEAADSFGLDLTPRRLARLVRWGRTRAPEAVRDEMFDFSVTGLGRLQFLNTVLPGRVARDELGNMIPQRS